jgi:hypothetical protein
MYEFDFLPVGDGERSGDAIALRFTNPAGSGFVTGIIDAGFAPAGQALVDHFQEYYRTRKADFVLCTHADADHIGGMENVLEQLQVGTFLIHRPANHGDTTSERSERVEDLVDLALTRGAKVVEPFRGVHGFDDSLLIAGPTQAYYRELLGDMDQVAVAQRKLSFAERYFGESRSLVATAVRKALASFPIELAFDDAGGDGNACNKSAAIISLVIDGKHFVFPSDVGVEQLNDAIDYLDDQGRPWYQPEMFVLPHHGSRHNIDRDTIERILGPRFQMPGVKRRGIAVASVSASSDCPSPRVANAAGRRGYQVFTTAGQTLWKHTSDAPPRNWTNATPLPPLEEDDHDD